jgi:hypothetical protein
MRRPTLIGVSILVMIAFLWACGPSPFKRQLYHWVDLVKQRYKAADIRSSTIPLFLSYSNDVPVGALPKSIALLDDRGEPEEARFFRGQTHADETLFVQWGSGFGHWGVFICPFGGRPQTNGFVGSFDPWEDGVVFWVEN